MAEFNGRQASETPSSSSSDLYTAQTTDRKDVPSTTTNGFAAPPASAKASPTPVYDDAGDTSEDMDMSDSSSSAASSDLGAQGPAHAGAKRKLSDADMENGADAATAAHDSIAPTKKAKLSMPAAANKPGLPATVGLPPEIWQQVFIHLSPAILSRCLRVCKLFNFCLTQMKAAPPASKKGATHARAVDSEAIWTQLRKTTYPSLPRPLVGFSELQMFQLIGGSTCQSCGKPQVKHPVNNVFSAGPGEAGVRVIFPFRLRLCGNCFTNDSLTDIQMLSKKHPAAPLTRGLPYAFRTSDGHFVPDHVRQLPNGVPAHLRLQKTFHKKDVDSILAELEEVNSFGDGAADEWRKGMTQKGKDAMADSSRWERWAGALPLGKDLADVLREYDLASFPRMLEEQQRPQRQPTSQHTHVNGALPAPPFHGAHPLPQPVHVFANTQPTPQQHAPSPSQPASHVQRPVRNAHEVEAARQARRADIEKRCLLLDPPLHANALQHIKAFRDTMQITTPMTDAQWENMLKPKILEEREAAELQEHQRAQQLAALQAAMPSAMPEDAFTRPAKEVYDREYELSQEPLRMKLGEYASDHINGHWHQGRSLDRDSAPLFAVDVLLHVYQRYISDKDAGNLSSVIDGAPKFQGSKQGTPPMEPSLSLDNMKWVFDNKVRSYTDPLRRELFICAGCAEDRKPKWFAFEGLIQHYGAKHTSSFSKGNVVVHWQTAQWPDEPPFYENPAAFIKSERKFSGAKGHGRSRGTPHGSIDETFHSEPPATMLSDNPMFSSGKSQGTGQNGYQQPHYSYQYQLAQPRADLSQEAQVAKFSADAREVWDQLDGVKELTEALECVRMQTVIHHVVVRFQERFGFKPHLDLLTDALATNNLMKPIKSTHALACKMCTSEQTDGTADQISYYARICKMKMYNISALITHFKITHQSHGPLEWERDLLELPDIPLVAELLRKPGMDDHKLALIATAFPSAFPSPLPRIGVISEAPQDPGPDSGLASRLVKKLTKGQPQSKKKRKGQTLVNDRIGSTTPGGDLREDEYDPRRPIFADNKPAELDLSRFDTDLARKDEPPSGGLPENFNLAPETLAALSSLQTSYDKEPDPRYRSPSIGRSDSRTASGNPSAPASLTQVTPDIAAILASLTGQTQGATASATPVSTFNQGPARTPMQLYDAYIHPVQQAAPTYSRAESHHPGSRYVPGSSHPGSTEPSPARYDGQDLQAALQRNSHRYSQNAHASHGEPAPHNAPIYNAPTPHNAPMYAAPPPQARSPPRYRVVYEDEPAYHQRHYQPQYQQPYDGQPAPVQYVPISEPPQVAAAPLPYRYDPQPPQHYAHPHPPAPKPLYVDQYGRPVELVPIDSAPAPVQYMPHPFDQQPQHAQSQSHYARYPPQDVYYDHQPAAPVQHQSQGGRYVYDDGGRGSVPRA